MNVPTIPRMRSHIVAAAAWIALLILPSLAWILIDQRIWPWDPGYYGYWALRLGREGQGFGEWLYLNFHALKYMPPMTVWLAQLFVPLRHLTGEVEPAILITILCAGAGTLVLVFDTAYRYAADQGANPTGRLVTGLAAMTVCGGAALFIGMSHVFFTEVPQTFASALCVWVALHAERRAPLRNATLVVLMLAVAFLVKATSISFVLPTLLYLAIALTVFRKTPRASVRKSEIAWLILAAALFVIAVAWYVINWETMLLHFVQATVGAEVQNYSDRYPVLVQLKYWILAVADAYSATRLYALAMAVPIVGALALALWRLRRSTALVGETISSGCLFGLYLAGMTSAMIFAYALQINQDPRFLAPILPLFAVLVGWALATLRKPAVTALVFVACTVNAVYLHAAALGMAPLEYRWLYAPDKATTHKDVLTRIVAASCQGPEEMPPNLVAISYAEVNSNNANFYAAKYHLETGKLCYYAELPQGDVAKVTAWLDETRAPFVVTAAPEQQDPANFVNPIAKPFAEAMATNPNYEVLPETYGRFLVYRRIAPGTP